MSLSVNSPAPDFTLHDTDNRLHTLAEFKGKWLLLYFYPKDETPGCTMEACSFRDNYEELNKYLTVVGISADTVVTHKKFQQHYQLPFMILADPKRVAISAYQVDGAIFPRRTTFLINPAGRIEKIYEKVNVATHTTQILKDIQELQKNK